jgi:argininosuccinate lyase
MNRSVGFDRRMYREDIEASIAHARMLARRKIIRAKDARAIVSGLRAIRKEFDEGRFRFLEEDEDIHMAVERRLTDRIGPAGGKLHTGRSRNDQVATDLRLYLIRRNQAVRRKLTAAIRSILGVAAKHRRTLLPAYTHLQRAQPTTLAHHLLAYAEMLLRDRERFGRAEEACHDLPLGSAAGTTTSFPLDRAWVARRLGFKRISGNSLDAVSDRDFVLETHWACVLLGLHLSRLGEEWTIWSSQEFSFLALPEALSSGSSIMPQKRNPDSAELLRAKSGRLIGNLAQLLVVLKGLPLAYNKDLQEDKAAVFESLDLVEEALQLTDLLVRKTRWRTEAMARAAREGAGHLLATQLADELVRKGIPFRQAHGKVRRWVERPDSVRSLAAVSLEELRLCSPLFDRSSLKVLDPWRAITQRNLRGGPAPSETRRAIERLRKKL